MPEPIPSPAELHAAVKDCYHAANQCASYHHWHRLVRPTLETASKVTGTQIDGYFANSQLEAVLLFFRKSHEFFKDKDPRDKSDSLYAYRWQYRYQGPMFDGDTLRELHKRVGHITVREARNGKVAWHVHDMAQDAITRWITFFGFLADVSYSTDTEMRQYCSECRSSLELVLNRLRAQVAEEPLET